MVITQNIQEIWDNIKRQNLRILGIKGEKISTPKTQIYLTKSSKKTFPM